jgi:hypothetical protein
MMQDQYLFHTRDELWQADIIQLNAFHRKILTKPITAYFSIISGEVKFTGDCPECIKSNIINAHFARFIAED